MIIALLLAPVTQAACDLDDFPVMSDMKVYPILANAIHNNNPMMIQGFVSEDSAGEVIGHYHGQWEGRFVDSVFGKWNQVSTMTDECFMTLQVAPAGQGSQGRMVVSNPPTIDAGTPLGEGVMKPADAIVVSDLITEDGPKHGRVSLLACSGSPDEVADYYRSNMASAGWRLQHDYKNGEAQVLVFRDGMSRSNVLIIPAGTVTQVLINSEEIE